MLDDGYEMVHSEGKSKKSDRFLEGDLSKTLPLSLNGNLNLPANLKSLQTRTSSSDISWA